ncbi:hypothetical protein [Microbacterium oleivorans]|uniref:hypothetical protein n=1 Tax=Microbacterium oleivorans TaxID=273677 RepID=UPI00080DA6D7|nr:hypothetical protein [Microbacterium oleivorans]
MDVLLDRQRLRDARDTLTNAENAFNDASKINDSLESAIDTPHGKSSLRDRVGWFESNWSGNREDLTEMIANVREGLSSILSGWDQWEEDASAQLEQMGSEGGN